MNARDELRKYVHLLADSWTPRERTDERVEWLYGQVRAEGLTKSERAFLTFALDLTADVMASRGDEFGDEDEAALTSLRAMATPAPAPVESAGDETGEAVVEYGVRPSPGDGVAFASPNREHVEGLAIQMRGSRYPAPRLMQRAARYGAWVEVAS